MGDSWLEALAAGLFSRKFAARFFFIKYFERVVFVDTSHVSTRPIGEDGAQLGDFIQDEDASDPSLIVQDLDVAESLRDSISRLPEREGRILALRYGFYDGVPRTLEEIGEEFDLTRERIRQLEKLALCRLRHPSFGIREQDLV